MIKEKIELALDALNDGWLATAKGILQDLINGELNSNKEIEEKKKLYLIDTRLTHQVSYVVEAETEENAISFLKKYNNTMDFLAVFKEEWDYENEIIDSVKEISAEEYLTEFDLENPHLKDLPTSEKFSFINRSR